MRRPDRIARYADEAGLACLYQLDIGGPEGSVTGLSRGNRFIVRDEWLGREIVCPAPECGKPLKLNPFVCDNRELMG